MDPEFAKEDDVLARLSTFDIMNVKTLIERAFGCIDENRVNFKLIQTILFLLARQLRILDRRVVFEGPFANAMENLSSLEVTEVKVHAMQSKKKGGKKGVDKIKPDKTAGDKGKDGAKSLKRTDSYVEPDSAPKPMASIDPVEAQYEKLLVVERVSSSSSKGSRGSPKLSIVTQEEFMKLVKTVRALQAHFGPIGTAGFPKNAQLMESLRQNASLTDAMAALQLSCRLEAVEKTLGRMTQLLSTVIGITPGIAVDSETRVFLGEHAATDLSTTSEPEMVKPRDDTRTTFVIHATESEFPAKSGDESETDADDGEFVTHKRLRVAIKDLHDTILKEVEDVTARNTTSANQAMKLASNLETKLTTSLNVGPRMANLESAVNAYTEQINAIDTGLTSQMSNYQEQLTQMQHELEIGLDAMAEAMANTGGDTVAMGELNNNFTTLQMDFEGMLFRQKRVSDGLEAVQANLSNLWKQIEMLGETKSDRDEVADALRDKAGIKDLNGLVPLEQFDAVRGDFEKRIEASYNKFNNQELIWQKAIDELLRELGEKGDMVQLECLKDGMLKHLNELSARMDAIAAIVGEPKTAVITKKLFRDSACICCSTPATMDMETSQQFPKLPKFPGGKRGEDSENKKEITGDGDTRPCYYGLPILHPIGPRAHYCQRYCGGSHTLIPSGPPKVPLSCIITPVRKEVTTELGTDGKVYKVDESCPEPKT